MNGTSCARASVAMAATLAAAWLSAAPVLAQQSASYRLDEHVLNQGGHPENGAILSSASFRIRLDSIGDGAIAIGLASSSFKVSAGFGAAYPPPGEVQGLRFLDLVTLEWDPEPSAGDYNLYRGLIGDLPSGGYGACQQSEIAAPNAADAAVPDAGTGYFYFATVENLLDEEGTKGFDSAGHERPNALPCP